jgi:hypothetical protein
VVGGELGPKGFFAEQPRGASGDRSGVAEKTLMGEPTTRLIFLCRGGVAGLNRTAPFQQVKRLTGEYDRKMQKVLSALSATFRASQNVFFRYVLQQIAFGRI